MGFEFIAFGAATVPLSKIVIDKELDMGTYPIKTNTIKTDTINEKTVGNGVFVDGLLIKDGVSYSPYRPQAWATDTLDWGDIPPSDPIPTPNPGAVFSESTEVEVFSLTTPAGAGRLWSLHFVNDGVWGDTLARVDVYVNGVSHTSAEFFTQHTVDLSFGAPANSTVSIKVKVVAPSVQTGTVLAGTTLTNTGMYFGGKTFDLTGKWLALGIDMKGLAATVKIHGVEVPYSDYAKYFPLIPDELKIPGGWDPTQERPVVRVYK